ncbi:MAG: FKBP-type peptidyl-prolyl cis-trans isomerase [Treponema sp.]|nr:FKBP-type peptidyl-prolyl cis-trans isomerase [Treponema sp.]
MKKPVVFLCLFLMVTALYARAIQDDYRSAEEKARVSYAFGMIFGSDLDSFSIDIDYDAFTSGVRAVLDKNIQPQFTEQEAMEIVEAAWYSAMEKAAEQHRMNEEEFLYTNSQRSGIQYTPSGLQYEILEYTEGEKPKANSVVRVHYTGTFTDGSLFDSSYEENGAHIPLEMVIRGWTEGLMLMSVGSKYILYIPSNLAYGRDGIQGFIPPYSTLIFIVELLEILGDDYDPFNLEF